MKEELAVQIAELNRVHKGLSQIAEKDRETVLSGPLSFEASADGCEPITDTFEIDMVIPELYPNSLPRVRETSDRIDSSYEHVFLNGTLCLAVPIAQRRLFGQHPTLLGFVNKLVVPYFYGYCYWEKYGEHPFGEQNHGAEGIVQYYIDTLNLADAAKALAVVLFLCKKNYRGHHDCPCGSGNKVRNCHGPMLLDFSRYHTSETLCHDLLQIYIHCVEKSRFGELSIPLSLRRKIVNLLNTFNSQARRIGCKSDM